MISEKSAAEEAARDPRIWDLARRDRARHYFIRNQTLEIVVERNSDGCVEQPLGRPSGVVVGQGDSYEEALSDHRPAIAFHVATSGDAALAPARYNPILYAFIAEAALFV